MNLSAKRGLGVQTGPGYVSRPPSASGEPVSYAKWSAARDQALAHVLAGQRRVVVVGPPGTGKTLLLRSLAGALRSLRWTVRLHTRGDIGTSPSDDVPGADSSAVLLIDEADRLTAGELSLLAPKFDGAVVLAGLESLAAEGGPAIVRLTPLEHDEVGPFLTAWLAHSGQPPNLLGTGAVTALVACSGGIPRVLAMLASAAIWVADMEHAAQVTAGHVAEAILLRDGIGLNAPSSTNTVDVPALAEAAPDAVAEPAAAPARGATPKTPSAKRLLMAGACAAAVLVLACGWLLWPAASPQRQASVQQTEPAAPRLPPVPSVALQPAAAEPASMSQPLQAEAVPAALNGLPALLAMPRSVDPSPAPELLVLLRAAEMPGQAALVAASASLAPPSMLLDRVPQLSTPKPPTPPLADPPPSTPAMAPAVVEQLLRRGNQALVIGDTSAARLLFARAATGGSAVAATAAGRAYDPAFLGGGHMHVVPDPAMAAEWYQRAAALGDPEASALLRRLQLR